MECKTTEWVVLLELFDYRLESKSMKQASEKRVGGVYPPSQFLGTLPPPLRTRHIILLLCFAFLTELPL